MHRKIEIYLVGIILSVFLLFLHPQNAFADPLGGWLSTTNLPINIASHVSTFESGKVFVFGGANVDDYSDVLSSTPNSDGTLPGWSLVSNLPETRYWGALVKKEKRIYILGGAMFTGITNYKNTVYSSTIQLDGSVASWQSLTSLPENRALGNAVVVGERIYYAGGFNNSGAQDEVYYATINSNGTLGSWNLAGLLPEPLSGFGMVEHNNNLVIVGGSNGSVFRNKAYKASVNPDGSLSAFTETEALPEPVYRAGFVKAGSTLFTVGGWNGSAMDEVYYAQISSDGTLSPWSLSSNHLPQPVCCAAATFSNGHLYLTGGYNGAYLNAVYYAPVNTITDFKQTDPKWSTSPPYDPDNVILSTRLNHSANCGDMYGFGCAVTSVADVFYSYGKTTLSNNEQLNPGTLNDWLSGDFKGFVGCSIYWNTASAAIEIGAPEVISRNNKVDWPNGIEKIDEALNNGDLPILGIKRIINGNVGTHFLVVSKRLSDVNGKPDYSLIDPALYPFTENDPGNSGKSLSQAYGGFDNVFQATVYKKGTTPQNTLAIGGHSPIQLFITDPVGNATGYDMATGNIIENIPSSSYGIEPGIIPIDGHVSPSLEKKYFQQINPTEGEYLIQVIGTESGAYTLGFARTDEQANTSTQLVEGITREGLVETYKIQYDDDTSKPLTIERIVTFDSLINDINSLRATGDINNFGIYISLLAKANAAKGLSFINNKASSNALRAMQNELEAQKGKGVSENAFNILNNDIQTLIETLQ